MPQSAVNVITKAGQWNSWALQVDGSNNPVTWIQQSPWQTIDISLVDDFGAFVSPNLDFEDGSVFNKSISRYPIELGTAYLWTGSDIVKDNFATCDANSVKITNKSGQDLSIGLTKYDFTTKRQQPICVDLVLANQPVTYTPILTIFAKVGRNYRASSVIGDVGNWTKFEITDVNSTFLFDETSSTWAAAGEKSTLLSKL